MSFNDPQWGRSSGSEKPREDEKEKEQAERGREQDSGADRDAGRRDEAGDNGGMDRDERRARRNSGDNSDLDALWNDFNRMINSMLGGGRDKNGRGQRNSWDDGDEPSMREQHGERREATSPFASSRRGARSPKDFPLRGVAVAAAVAVVGWLASGVYIVPEGQVGVVTTFGRYSQDSSAGINWRMPWPVQQVEIVDVSSVRKAEIGMRGTTQRLKEALMLTDDENIVDVMFNVQYRIKPHAAKDFLFRSRDPERSVFDAAESAMREVVGRKTMDSVLFESKQEIASAVQKAMQSMLDRYQTGIEVMSVAIQNAQPPQQVQAAFNDAVKAGQDRERQINEGQAYANAVVPAARGMASRLEQEAEAYKARVVQTAQGDAERFSKVLEQYKKAPKVTRDRLYIDTMREVYGNTKKVLVEAQGSNNLLYLPLDKLLEQNAAAAAPADVPRVNAAAPAAGASTSVTTAPQSEGSRVLMRDRGR